MRYCDGVQAIEFSNGGEVRVRRKYGYTGVESQVDVMNHANGWFRQYSIQAEILVSQCNKPEKILQIMNQNSFCKELKT